MDDVRKLPFCCGQDVEITIEGGCVGSIAAICIAFEDVTYKVEWFEGRSLRSEWFRSQQLAATSKVRTGTTIGFKTPAKPDKVQTPEVESVGRRAKEITAAWIEGNYGPRCLEVDRGCECCNRWALFDELFEDA